MANLVNGLGGIDGFGTLDLAANDDGSTGAIDLTSVFSSGFNLFGTTYNSFYINNNGNITFAGPLSTYTPYAIGTGYTSPIIAPFWADVDTRGGATAATGGNSTGSNVVWYNVSAATKTITITWDDVGYYSGHTDKTDAFQLQLTQLANGNDAISFIYENVSWVTGDASGGTAGLGGSVAQAGYSAGNGVNYYDIPSSGTQETMLTLPTTVGNTGTAGIWQFIVGQSGTILSNPVITGTAANQHTTDTGTIAPFGTVIVTDPNLGQTETVTVTLSSAANGTLTNLGAGAYNATTGIYSITGSAAAVSAALDGLRFVPTAHEVAPGQTITTGFTITDTDTAGASATDIATSIIVNTGTVLPTITGAIAGQIVGVPGSIAPFGSVVIGDLNFGQTETVTVRLSAAANGTLTNLGAGSYNATTGVYTDTGSAAAVTTALDGLKFTPTASLVPQNGSIATTFTIGVADTAGAAAANAVTSVIADTIAAGHTITFSEYPVGTTNPVYTYTDNTVDVIGQIVTDTAQPDSPAVAANTSYVGPVYIDFTNPVQNVSFVAGYFDNLQSTTVTFLAPGGGVLASSLNTAYGIVPYNYSSAGGISAIEVVNTGYDASGFSVDTVVFSGSGTTVATASTFGIAAASANKPDGAGLTPFTFTITRSGNTTGTGSIGWAVTGSGSNPLVAADLPAGNFPQGSASFAAGQVSQTVTVNISGGLTLSAAQTFAVTLFGPTAGEAIGTGSASGTILPSPKIAGTVANQHITDTGTITPFGSVTVTDPNLNQTETLTVTESTINNGTLINPGAGAYNAATGVYTITGSAAAVSAALDGLRFVPVSHEVAPGQTVTTGFTIAVTDSLGGSAIDTATSVIVNAGTVLPTITGVIGTIQPVTDSGTILPFSGVTIGDINFGQVETATVRLSAAANGTLSNPGGGSYNASTGVYTATGSAAVITSDLDGLVFTPTPHQVVQGQTVATTFTITDTDTASQTATDSRTTVVATAVSAPALSVTGANFNNAATSIALSGTIDASDATASVGIYDGSVLLTTVAARAGAWNATLAVSAAGTHTVTARAANGAGTGASAAVTDVVSGSASLTGGGQIVLIALASSSVSLIDTTGTNDRVVTYTGNDTINMTGASATFSGSGGNAINFTGYGNVAALSGTGGNWDYVSGSGGTISLTGAQTAVTGAGNTINFAGGSGNVTGLYSTAGIWDTLYGSGGTIYLTGAQAAVIGGGDTISLAGGSASVAGLYTTGGSWDQVWAPGGDTVYLTNAQAAITGGANTISFAGGTGNVAGLYNTGGNWDAVWAPGGGTIYLNSAQAAVTGGGDTISFASGTGNTAGLYNTFGSWDSVWAPGGDTIYLTNAQAGITGGGDTISFAGGSGNVAGLYSTGGTKDSVWAPGGDTIYFTNAQAVVTGGGDVISFAGGSGNEADLSTTNGNWDAVWGSNATIFLFNAQAALTGGSDTFGFLASFGLDAITGFGSTDSMQFSLSDFANWAGLSSHMTQSGANTVIAFNAANTVTLDNVSMGSLTASQFHFV